jgi:predicted phage tail protein
VLGSDSSISELGEEFGRRTSYYVEENERILNLLITNCEPILSEMVSQVDHFNTYNGIKKVVEKNGVNIEEFSI